jgi:3-oxoacyl-[acyl-carrier protein] reductase
MTRSRPTALITGASQGIGAAIAEKLAGEGFFLVLLDHAPEGASKLLARLSAPGFAQACDVSRADQVSKAVEAAHSQTGRIDALINNAGVGGPFHRLDEVSEEEWDWIMQTNLKGTFLLLKYVLPIMRQQNYGRIVNIASVQGFLGASRSSTYVASKHGVIGYTKSVCAEWGQHQITCNAICPGYIDTKMGVQSEKIDSHLQSVLDKTPIHRIGKPQEVAELAAFLVRPESAFMNGAILTLDGGLTAHLGVS